MQMVQLPDEIATLKNASSNLFVYFNGVLMLDSAFLGTALSADYDIVVNIKLNFNKKTKAHDILQLVCPRLNARWIYRHSVQNSWILVGKFPY